MYTVPNITHLASLTQSPQTVHSTTAASGNEHLFAALLATAGAEQQAAQAALSGATPLENAENAFVTEPMDTRRLSHTMDNGNSIKVSKLRTDNGEAVFGLSIADSSGRPLLEAEFTGDVRVGKTADGSTAVYSEETKTTRIYNDDGTYTELSGNHLPKDGDTIIVSTTGEEISGGNGKNLFMVYGDDTTLLGGSGDDTFVLADGITGTTINSGDGNDTVLGINAFDTILNLGEGDNTVRFTQTLRGGTIQAGNGNNILELNEMNAVVAKLGNGDNSFKAKLMINGARMETGDGTNRVEVASLGREYAFTPAGEVFPSSATLLLGKGNNFVNIGQMVSNSTLIAGDGDNVLDLGRIDNACARLGSGKNTDANGNPISSFSGSGGSLTAQIKTDAVIAAMRQANTERLLAAQLGKFLLT